MCPNTEFFLKLALTTGANAETYVERLKDKLNPLVNICSLTQLYSDSACRS